MEDDFSYLDTDSLLTIGGSFASESSTATGTAKSLIKTIYEANRVWFEEAKRLKGTKPQFYQYLSDELSSWEWPVYTKPKPLRKRLYYCIKNLPLKTILSDVTLYDWYSTKIKQILSKKKKKFYRTSRRYFRRSFKRNYRRSYRRSYRKPYRRSYRRRYYRRY